MLKFIVLAGKMYYKCPALRNRTLYKIFYSYFGERLCMRILFFWILLFLVGYSCKSNPDNIRMAQGKEVYIAHCVSCHQADGKGIPGVYPPLVKPDIIRESQTIRAIGLIKNGSGYSGGMNPLSLTTTEITDVLNYIQNSWGNMAPILLKSNVEAIKNP